MQKINFNLTTTLIMLKSKRTLVNKLLLKFPKKQTQIGKWDLEIYYHLRWLPNKNLKKCLQLRSIQKIQIAILMKTMIKMILNSLIHRNIYKNPKLRWKHLSISKSMIISKLFKNKLKEISQMIILKIIAKAIFIHRNLTKINQNNQLKTKD